MGLLFAVLLAERSVVLPSVRLLSVVLFFVELLLAVLLFVGPCFAEVVVVQFPGLPFGRVLVPPVEKLLVYVTCYKMLGRVAQVVLGGQLT